MISSFVFPSKGNLPRNLECQKSPLFLQKIKNDSQRPHIRFRRISLPCNDFGSYQSVGSAIQTDIVERSAGIIEFFPGENKFGEAKVGDFDVEETGVAENVLRFDVAMNDAHVVKITETVGEGSDDLIGLQLAENGSSADIAVQFAASQELHDDIHVLRVQTRGHEIGT